MILLDIFPKILLKNPITNETIIESFQKIMVIIHCLF